MQSVKVRRTGISAEEAAEVLRDGLGGDYEVAAEDETTVLVRKGTSRARVVLRAEDGGTAFDVSGAGASVLPLFKVVTKLVNDQGIAKKAAAAIDGAESFRDDG